MARGLNPANPSGALSPNNRATRPLDATTGGASVPTRTASLTLLDVNRDGYISAEELASNAQARSAVIGCDTDHDGKIASYEYTTCTNGQPQR
ncbi:MAG TPA: hypothetical protein VM555_06345 [Tahibacter sp.]|nr:hypothetical protein [Tahibacter sp.]